MTEKDEQLHPRGFRLADVRCDKCIYWRGAGIKKNGEMITRACWRYPAPVDRLAAEWCGEFDPLKGAMS
jgi:hypothetical protein